jgi:hypothetical protein
MRSFALMSAILATAAMPGCVHGPETLNVRVRNHAAHNLMVMSVSDPAAGKEELVYPGAFSQSHAGEVLVRAPDASIRLEASPANVSNANATGYRYKHLQLREIGRRDIVFEVMVDNENRTWVHALDGGRVPFPAEVMREE